MRPSVREALKIVVDGDEIPGLIAYGLRRRDSPAAARFPADAWIAQPECTDFTLHGETWEVLMWEVPIIIWPAPSELQVALRTTLWALIEAGSRVAWIGALGLPFCDPPELLDPHCMSGGVLAWMTDTGAADCFIDPDASIMPVGDDVLLTLRTHAAGLADTT